MSATTAVKVAVRVRPMNSREIKMNAKEIVTMNGNQTMLQNPNMDADVKKFSFDYSYNSSCESTDRRYVNQTKVYNDLGLDVVNACFDGFNACVFAYGQTGSGKSYSMMGYGEKGLIPRICEGIFAKSNKLKGGEDKVTFKCDVEYLEIYNEKVRDLLSDTPKGELNHSLKVREDPKLGPYVEGLTARTVTDFQGIDDLMEAGNKNRTTAKTNMNDTSSRSHAVFTLRFTQATFIQGVPCEKTSKINLVDLAGSERTSSTGATGQRLKEGGNINKSLTTLGLVISALAERSQKEAKKAKSTPKKGDKPAKIFVPYRDSVLTWLLKESLGGNSKTIMLAALSPADVNYGETLSTLHYANRAKNIVNKAMINEDENVRIIKELRGEILKLKELLGGDEAINKLTNEREAAQARLDAATTEEDKALAEKDLEQANAALNRVEDRSQAQAANLRQAENMMSSLTDAWKEKWQGQTKMMEERALDVKESGKALTIDSQRPHLVSLNLDDPLATGVTLYYLEEGVTLLGKAGTVNNMGSPADINLSGEDSAANHCEIHNEGDETVILTPVDGACMVNGTTITEPTEISQGNTIVLGRDNIFRFNHPKHATRLRSRQQTAENGLTDETTNSLVFSPGQIFEDRRAAEKQALVDTQKELKELRDTERERAVEFEQAASEKKKVEEDLESKAAEAQNLTNMMLKMREIMMEREQKMTELEKTKAQDLDRESESLKIIQEEKAAMELARIEAERELEEMKAKNAELELLRKEAEEQRLAEANQRENAVHSKLKEIEDNRTKAAEEANERLEEQRRLAADMESKVLAAEQRMRDQELAAEAERKEAERIAAEHASLLSERQAERQAQEEARLKLDAEKLRIKQEAEMAKAAAQKSQEQLTALKELNDAKEMEATAQQQKRLQEEVDMKLKFATLEKKLKRAETLTVRHRDEVQSFDDIWNIKIPRFHIRDIKGEKPFVVYEVKVWLRGEEWKVFRRYSQFEGLNRDFRRRFPNVMKEIVFPTKGPLFKKSIKDSQFLKERRISLESYLKELVLKTHTTTGSPFYRASRQKLQRESAFFNNAAALQL
eukprot:m.198902 g.198902  ORF g.198902 m.198902 type:complete len:1075 (-) comp32712_c0_seq1:40-3264(-)